MKVLFLFFSIYLVVLSCIPCSDTSECAVETKMTFSSADNHQHDHSNEACTPFCLCSCCSVSVFYNAAYKAQSAKPVVFSTIYFIRQDKNIHSMHNAIWQPPRLTA